MTLPQQTRLHGLHSPGSPCPGAVLTRVQQTLRVLQPRPTGLPSTEAVPLQGLRTQAFNHLECWQELNKNLCSFPSRHYQSLQFYIFFLG